MYCKNCGATIPDQSNFCTTCGAAVTPDKPTAPVEPAVPVQPVTPVQPVAPVQPTAPVQPATPVQPAAPIQQPVYQQPVNGQMPYAQQYASPTKKSKKGLVIIVLILVAIVAVAIALIVNLTSKNRSPESAVKAYVEALDDQDLNALLSVCAKPYRDLLQGYVDLYFDGSAKDFWNAMFSSSFHVSCSVIGKEKLDSYDLVELNERIEYWYDAKMDVKEAYEIEISASISSTDYDGESSVYENETEMIVIKDGGKWYIINAGGLSLD